ncbi:hypothetical protein G9A89_014158 [Geosiphon pyriformis]|nr:hypothetical protein G9A89_014158 [Geosiphon pyriformis]
MNLPVDLLSHLIEPLKNDKKSLHSCLLVNRLWCRAVVPCLYRDSFNLLWIEPDHRHRDQARCLLRTYFSCLSNETKDQISSSTSIDLSSLRTERSPIFKYQIYLENLSDSKLLTTAGSFFINKEFFLGNYVLQPVLFKAIYEMFIQDAQGLQVLLLHGIFWNIQISVENISKIINLIQKKQTQLQKITISFRSTRETNERVIKNGKETLEIIKGQQKLETLLIEASSEMWTELFLNTIKKEEKIHKGLRLLKFVDCTFGKVPSLTRNYFEGFKSLRKVTFINCEGFSEEFIVALPGRVDINIDSAESAFYAQKALCLSEKSDLLADGIFGNIEATESTKNLPKKHFISYFHVTRRTNTIRLERSKKISKGNVLVNKKIWARWASSSKEFKKKVNAIEKLKEAEYTFTGFGDAAAIATLAALNFEKKYKITPRIVTFGLQKMGNEWFAKMISYKQIGYRVTHADEDVGQIPFPYNGEYSHFGMEYWLPGESCECEQGTNIHSTIERPQNFILYKCPPDEKMSENPDCNAGVRLKTPFKKIVKYYGPYFGYSMEICPNTVQTN